LSSAAATGKLLQVDVVDQAGRTVEVLVAPARARVFAAAKEPILVPRKGIAPGL
jgi:hypothetical protein